MPLYPVLRPVLQPVLRSPIGRLRAGGGSSTDADAAAWAAAVTANSGTYSAATLTAVDTFVRAAKASGYWTKLNRINLFCGDQLAAALVPLKVGGGTATDTNVNFVAGDYTEATGLTGNGTTKRLRTGLIPSVSLALNDTHLAIYNRGTSAQVCALGANDGTNFLQFLAPFNGSVIDSYQYNSAAGLLEPANPGAPFGLMVSSRIAANSHAVYRGAASLGSNATSGGALPPFEVCVFASNASGSGTFHSPVPVGAYSIGSGLTAADVTAYNTHMEAFQDALGRGVI